MAKKAIAREKEGEWVWVTCGFCSGTRRNPTGWGKCQACGGKGRGRVKTPYYQCAYCQENGHASPTSGMSCVVCKGKGVVTMAGPVEVCPACNGHGRDMTSPHQLPCIVCGGKGAVPV